MNLDRIGEHAEAMFGVGKSSSMLEVDDEGGRMFLRVLIHLTMHDYPPLISGSLQLLFKHFSQRQEVLHTFKQVTLRGPRTPRAWLWVEDMGWILALSLGGRPGRSVPQTGNPWECRCRSSS